MQNISNHVVIMAGGVGSRFWPMSTTQLPKQFVDILGIGKTLIQMTVERFAGLCPKENLWVVTGQRYVSTVKAQIPEIPDDHILAEPVGRGTAPCIAYACWKISARFPDANIVFTPADALVINVGDFRNVIESALDFAAVGDRVVTVGIKPSRPETGYGYIEAGAEVDSPSGCTEVCRPLYKVDSFREKPDRATAEFYVSQDKYYWNAGIFVWNVRTIVSLLRRYIPDTSAIMDRLSPSFYTDGEYAAVEELFPKCDKISIDYAVMEKAGCIYTVPADFGWSDLGTWGSLKTLISNDECGNAVARRGEDEFGQVRLQDSTVTDPNGCVRIFDCNNCIVHVPDTKKVVVQGLDGYIVAEHGDRLLVCRLDNEQKITDYIK